MNTPNLIVAATVAAAEAVTPVKAKEKASHFTITELTRSTTSGH